MKRKYWYKTQIEECVLCWKQKITRTRVYSEDQRGVDFREFACNIHFI